MSHTHTRHRNISSAVINPNSLEQGTLRDFVDSGPFSDTIQGLKGPTNIKTRLEISTKLKTAFPHSPSLELLPKRCRLESLEKSIQNFGVLLLPKQPISQYSHSTWSTWRRGLEFSSLAPTAPTIPPPGDSLIEPGPSNKAKSLLVTLPNFLSWHEKCDVFFKRVWSNWINWLTGQHFTASREIFLLNPILLFGQNWKSPFWHKTELFEP